MRDISLLYTKPFTSDKARYRFARSINRKTKRVANRANARMRKGKRSDGSWAFTKFSDDPLLKKIIEIKSWMAKQYSELASTILIDCLSEVSTVVKVVANGLTKGFERLGLTSKALTEKPKPVSLQSIAASGWKSLSPIPEPEQGTILFDPELCKTVTDSARQSAKAAFLTIKDVIFKTGD